MYRCKQCRFHPYGTGSYHCPITKRNEQIMNGHTCAQVAGKIMQLEVDEE